MKPIQSLARVPFNVASKGKIFEFSHVILDKHVILMKVVQLV